MDRADVGRFSDLGLGRLLLERGEARSGGPEWLDLHIHRLRGNVDPSKFGRRQLVEGNSLVL